MFKTYIVILFSFVLIATILPSRLFLLKNINVIVLLNTDENTQSENTDENKKSPESENVDGEEKEDVEEKQLFLTFQGSELLFHDAITQIKNGYYISSQSSFALRIQLPPPKLQA